MQLNILDIRGVVPKTCRPILTGVLPVTTGLGISAEDTLSIHDPFLNPVDDQGQTGTCEARSACGVVETLIREYVNPNAFQGGKQLDATYWHREAFKLEYPGREYSDREGLPLGATFRAMKSKGMLPYEAQLVSVSPNYASMRPALVKAPLQIGVNLHNGWRADRVNRETGEIPVDVITGVAGHGVKVVSLNAGRGGLAYWGIENSWGEGWAWHGIGQIEHDHLIKVLLDDPILLTFDYTWLRYNQEWRGYVVTV